MAEILTDPDYIPRRLRKTDPAEDERFQKEYHFGTPGYIKREFQQEKNAYDRYNREQELRQTYGDKVPNWEDYIGDWPTVPNLKDTANLIEQNLNYENDIQQMISDAQQAEADKQEEERKKAETKRQNQSLLDESNAGSSDDEDERPQITNKDKRNAKRKAEEEKRRKTQGAGAGKALSSSLASSLGIST